MKQRSAAESDVFDLLKWNRRRMHVGRAAAEVAQPVPAHPMVEYSGEGEPHPTALPNEIASLHRQLRSAHWETIMALVAAVEAKDPYTERHSVHVAIYSECLAQVLHVPPRETAVIKNAAMMHDIGKIGVPDAILTKPGRLTKREFDIIKKHPATGAAILQSATCLQGELPLVLHHHEWYGGKGYPHGLRGDEIPFGARILHVADSIDAMLLPRSYKQGYAIDKVLSELRRGRGSQFDPDFADAAEHWLHESTEQLITERGTMQCPANTSGRYVVAADAPN